MNRRHFIEQSSKGLIGAYLLSMATSCSRKTNYHMFKDIPETSPFQMKFIRGRVGCFTEKGGAIGWMVDGKHTVLVDTQFPEQAANLSAQLKKITDEKIDVIFNTHHHADHTSGNIFFKDKVEKIIAHRNSISNQRNVATQKNNLNEVILPSISIDDTYSIKVGNESINTYYYGSAHTNGDIVVHFIDSNVVHLGDLVFNRRFPYIDMGAGASIKSWIEVLEKIINQFDQETIFIAGHAGQGYDVIINKEDIKAYQHYLEQLWKLGESNYRAGKTKEEVLKNFSTVPGAPEWKGDGINRSIEAVYYELSQSK